MATEIEAPVNSRSIVNKESPESILNLLRKGLFTLFIAMGSGMFFAGMLALPSVLEPDNPDLQLDKLGIPFLPDFYEFTRSVGYTDAQVAWFLFLGGIGTIVVTQLINEWLTKDKTPTNKIGE